MLYVFVHAVRLSVWGQDNSRMPELILTKFAAHDAA